MAYALLLSYQALVSPRSPVPHLFSAARCTPRRAAARCLIFAQTPSSAAVWTFRARAALLAAMVFCVANALYHLVAQRLPRIFWRGYKHSRIRQYGRHACGVAHRRK